MNLIHLPRFELGKEKGGFRLVTSVVQSIILSSREKHLWNIFFDILVTSVPVCIDLF